MIIKSQPRTIRLSLVARDPELAAFFERGERDSGAQFAAPAGPKPVLDGSAARVMEVA